MEPQTILDQTIRSIVRDEIKKANQSVFSEEVDVRLDNAISDYMENHCEKKVMDYLENNIDVGDSVNEVITNGSFDISFSG